MRIWITIQERGQLQNGVIVYRPAEHSFDTEPTPIRGFTSILVNDVNLEIDKEGRLVSVWGLCSHHSWERGPVPPPNRIRAEVKLHSDLELSRGVSQSVTGKNRWENVYDIDSGWLVTGRSTTNAIYVEPLLGSILGIEPAGALSSLWLYPGKGFSAHGAASE